MEALIVKELIAEYGVTGIATVAVIYFLYIHMTKEMKAAKKKEGNVEQLIESQQKQLDNIFTRINCLTQKYHDVATDIAFIRGFVQTKCEERE